MTSFFLDQHGCAKNQVDGELLIARLVSMGLVRTMEPEKADIIIVNTCGFIESAKTESLNAVMDARSCFPNAKILLAGCLAERYADVFASELPEVDGIIGNGDISALDGIVQPLLDGKRPVEKPEQQGVSCGSRVDFLSFPGSAYVKITEGCDNRCSFCAIPLIRGGLRSRPTDEIVEEIRDLLARGIFEINLVGQDSAAYGMDGMPPHDPTIWSRFDGSAPDGMESPLALLLRKISALSGNFWLRLLYIHPDHFPLDILPVISADKRLLPYFDIPFQSGSDSVIRAMNRTGNCRQYISLVDKIRAAFVGTGYGGIALRTTFLTGFPGETEADADNTVSFLSEIRPDWSGCFPYSREDDTPAASMKRQVPAKVAQKRAGRLESLQEKLTAEALRSRVGQVYDVLIEEVVDGGDGEGTGLAIARAWFQAPDVDGVVVVRYEPDSTEANQIYAGNLVSVRVTGTSGVDLTGEPA